MSARRLDAATLREWAHTAVGELIKHTDEINALNVFPVADADTGTNMLFTMRSAWAQADSAPSAGTGHDSTADDLVAVTAALADGALHGARGNSGVILSQILRGCAEVTAEAGAPAVDGPLFAAALRRAEELVVVSMGGAVPGTIVSVLRAAAAAAEHATREDAAEPAGTAEVVRCATDAAVVALEKTPDQLEVLARAGVVDAGGLGLLVLLDALTLTLTGQLPHRPEYRPAPQQHDLDTEPAAPPLFEVMYQLSRCDAAGAEQLRHRLEAIGDSVAIAASGSGGYSVHVHADDAGAAVEAGLAVGVPRRIQITSLGGGAHPPGGWSRDRATLAVVDGGGAADLFAAEGASVLRRGVDTPISAQQLLRALIDTGAAQIMVLPNGYVAAEELVAGCTAAIGWGIDVVPVPAASMVQGLAALAVHDPGRQAVDDGYTMAGTAAATRHGSVRVATARALTWAGPCEPGDGLGISGGEVLIVQPDIAAAGAGLVDLLLSGGGELVTVLTGADVDTAVADVLRAHVHQHHPGIELAVYDTDHRGDALLIGVE